MRGLLSNPRVLETRIGRALKPAFAAINPPMTSHQKEIKMVMIFRNRLDTINRFMADIPDLKLNEQTGYLAMDEEMGLLEMFRAEEALKIEEDLEEETFEYWVKTGYAFWIEVVEKKHNEMKAARRDSDRARNALDKF